MALPSQTERTSETNRSVTGQGGGNSAATTAMLILAAVVLIGGGVYALSNMAKKPGEAGKLAESAGTTTPAATPANPTTTPVPAVADAAPSGTPAAGTPAGQPAGMPVPFGSQPATTPTPTTVVRSDVNNPAPGTQPAAPAPGNSTGTTAPAATPAPGTAINTPAPAIPTAVTTNLSVLQLIQQGDSAQASNKLVEARAAYSRALLDRDASDADKANLRSKLAIINQDLVFGARVEPGDTLVESYQVQPGDSLVRIARRRELATDWRFIQRVNRITNPNALRAGQTLKLVRGPFHAVVSKGAYRADIFAGAPDDPANWLFIKSYSVGLGEGNSTPVGNYLVKKGSKLIDPPWVNPRTGEKFASNDPKNPIGEHWIGWQGVGDAVANQGYGFHGTIDPASIGQQRSMGCVRMKAEDVAELYEMLVEEVSVVRVLP